ncbi:MULTISPECIES: hypothetical protein [Sorangium]|uniref:Uncharacterized protein n=1 Tax=Sorangium cellulosum TaxID=56 RepID=A0A4P2R513_SORCE|nr:MULTISPECIES: hypothetical protein [Sorangium]AUX37866.1 uncharacterized protein SOCE836_101020 [Sorangium cellulosum]WCQ97155.1 hypothetical protein NQZ70_09946 [Sorangium sp. Soce836]
MTVTVRARTAAFGLAEGIALSPFGEGNVAALDEASRRESTW